MSDDLISRSALVKEIENIKVPYGNDNESYISMPRVLDIISEQPKAYDVDAVCEKLGEMQIIANTYNEKVYIMAIEKAIEIVKNSERRWHR